MRWRSILLQNKLFAKQLVTVSLVLQMANNFRNCAWKFGRKIQNH